MLTVTLDGKSLNVEELNGFLETVRGTRIEWDAWENGAYKRKLKIVGSTTGWVLRCYENSAVTWTNSAAKHLQGKTGTDATVTFSVSEGDLHSVNTDVYVLSVVVGYDVKYRRFTVTLQEA